VDPFRLIADRKIQQAMDEGVFDNLAGRGRPLPLEEEPFEDPSLRMAHRLLRNNGFAPAWMEEGREIDAAVERLLDDRRAGRLTAEEFRSQAVALNRRILAFNLCAPFDSAHRLMIRF
jgi:Domain of unknown function (DUF1992)